MKLGFGSGDEVREHALWLTLAFVIVAASIVGLQVEQARAQHLQVSSTELSKSDIQALIAKYALSIDKADTTLAGEVWSKSDDVSFIHPLGHEHGFDQVREDFYVRLMEGTFSARALSIKSPSIHIYGDTAWAEFYWDFIATLRKNGSSLETKGRETQIYRKEADGWRLVHVHYSGMPVTGTAGF